MVLKQHRSNDDVLIIDVSKGFVRMASKTNSVLVTSSALLIQFVTAKKFKLTNQQKVSRDVINGYNLNIPRYVDSSEEAVQYDIAIMLLCFGGIPESEIDSLNKYWEALPSLLKMGELFINVGGRW